MTARSFGPLASGWGVSRAKVRPGTARRAKLRVRGARRWTARWKVFGLETGSAWATLRGLVNVRALATRVGLRACLLNFFVFAIRGIRFSGAPGFASVALCAAVGVNSADPRDSVNPATSAAQTVARMRIVAMVDSCAPGEDH